VTQRTQWGRVGLASISTTLFIAAILYFLLPDHRWIAAVVAGVTVIDAFVFWFLLPKAGGGGGAPTLDDLDRMNAEAEAATQADDNWSKPQDDV
jgi:hypothetical protein